MNTGASTRTRSGRLRLVARLDLADHAAGLLHSKETALERERVRLAGYASRAETEWKILCEEAAAWLLRARTLGASGELRQLIIDGPPPASVTPQWQVSMGITYPGSVRSAPGDRPLLTSTAALGPTSDAYRRALDAGALHAATIAAVGRLDAELAATRRRRKAIEDRLRPRLETTLRELDLHLDELDREEAVRVRVARNQQERARS
jgi:vacuolar-type H+-ATPase subunit D/Vma8